jgi:hypothetical protein
VPTASGPSSRIILRKLQDHFSVIVGVVGHLKGDTSRAGAAALLDSKPLIHEIADQCVQRIAQSRYDVLVGMLSPSRQFEGSLELTDIEKSKFFTEGGRFENDRCVGVRHLWCHGPRVESQCARRHECFKCRQVRGGRLLGKEEKGERAEPVDVQRSRRIGG